jgi:hypothetical protein
MMVLIVARRYPGIVGHSGAYEHHIRRIGISVRPARQTRYSGIQALVKTVVEF